MLWPAVYVRVCVCVRAGRLVGARIRVTEGNTRTLDANVCVCKSMFANVSKMLARSTRLAAIETRGGGVFGVCVWRRAECTAMAMTFNSGRVRRIGGTSRTLPPKCLCCL